MGLGLLVAEFLVAKNLTLVLTRRIARYVVLGMRAGGVYLVFASALALGTSVEPVTLNANRDLLAGLTECADTTANPEFRKQRIVTLSFRFKGIDFFSRSESHISVGLGGDILDPMKARRLAEERLSGWGVALGATQEYPHARGCTDGNRAVVEHYWYPNLAVGSYYPPYLNGTYSRQARGNELFPETCSKLSLHDDRWYTLSTSKRDKCVTYELREADNSEGKVDVVHHCFDLSSFVIRNDPDPELIKGGDTWWVGIASPVTKRTKGAVIVRDITASCVDGG